MAEKAIDRTLAEMWVSYARAVISPSTSPVALLDLKFAFYAGASCTLDVLTAIGGDDVSEDAGVDAIERLHQELRLFARQQGAAARPGN